jgi:hypothetical protein
MDFRVTVLAELFDVGHGLFGVFGKIRGPQDFSGFHNATSIETNNSEYQARLTAGQSTIMDFESGVHGFLGSINRRSEAVRHIPDLSETSS